MGQDKVLLLGGAGFLGQGLYWALSDIGINADIIDKADMDLSDSANISGLAGKIQDSMHIFLLASQVGADLFERDPAQAGLANKAIFDNVMSATLRSGRQNIRFYYYSTSEVYWSLPSADVLIDGNMRPGGIDASNPRSVYALVKLDAERRLAERMRFFPVGDIVSYTIIRPFNVFGPGQRRGVVYQMLKSCIKDGIIRYSEDTTRTLTSLSYISKATVGLMTATGYREANMSDGISTYMKTLAEAVRIYAAKAGIVHGIKLENLPFDRSIRYRQASPVTEDAELVLDFLERDGDFQKLAQEVCNELSYS